MTLTIAPTTVLSQIDGYIFDLDGTVYVGDSLLPGAAAAIAELRQRGKAVLFVSNKPIEPREAYARKLTRLGIPATPDDVITSAYVLARYLAQHAPGLRYYAIGEPSFLAELAGQGLNVAGELADQDPRWGHHAGRHRRGGGRLRPHARLSQAQHRLSSAAPRRALLCHEPRQYVPHARRRRTGCWGHARRLERISGRVPELIAGKPSPLIVETALGGSACPQRAA